MEIVSTAVAVIVCRGEGPVTEILLMRRAKGLLRGEWCQVTGKIERDETGWQAAKREVREETGVSEFDLYTAGYCDSFYNPEADRIEVLPIFVALFAADQIVKTNHENTECRWVQISEAEGILPFVGHRIALREVITDFVKRSPPGWRAIKHHTKG
jgi:dATP pyrophosphohydrolase